MLHAIGKLAFPASAAVDFIHDHGNAFIIYALSVVIHILEIIIPKPVIIRVVHIGLAAVEVHVAAPLVAHDEGDFHALDARGDDDGAGHTGIGGILLAGNLLLFHGFAVDHIVILHM